MGISLSYDQILELTKSVSDSSVHQYSMDGVFAPSNKGIFTLVAKDNIDQNARSTTAGRHYHGTSMIIMQYPTKDNPGQVQTIAILETNATKSTSKKSKKLAVILSRHTTYIFSEADGLICSPMYSGNRPLRI